MSKPFSARKHVDFIVDSPLPKLLMLTHGMGGGVARHLAELSDALQGKALVVQMSARGSVVDLYMPWLVQGESAVRIAFKWPEQQGLLWRFVAQLGITQTHVHHVLNWPSGFWNAFSGAVQDFDLTLHDHSIFSVVQQCEALAVADVQWLRQVQRCFADYNLGDAQSLYQLALQARRLLVPSRDLYARVQCFFPELYTDRLRFQPHPEVELQQDYPQPFMRHLHKEEPLRVLCLGMLSAEKGAKVLAKVARKSAKLELPLEFHLLGSCHVHLPDHIRRHGRYDDLQLPSLLAEINPHVLWLPAQCPETWSYTLSAGLRSGLPVVATRTGVFPERLQQRPLSWLCDVDYSVEQWIGLLQQVRDKHVFESVGEYVWHYSQEVKFYTAEQDGYVLDNTVVIVEDHSPLAGWELDQALVLGLPEVKGWREYFLRLLLKVKYSTALSPLVRLIPYTWQRRIKRMISRAPLHEPTGH